MVPKNVNDAVLTYNWFQKGINFIPACYICYLHDNAHYLEIY